MQPNTLAIFNRSGNTETLPGNVSLLSRNKMNARENL